MAAASGITEFGQQVDLTARIREVLRGYPAGTAVFSELLQNADDARATTFTLCLDLRTHGVASLLPGGGAALAALQGPALLAHNDASFTAADFAGIQRLGDSGKAGAAAPHIFWHHRAGASLHIYKNAQARVQERAAFLATAQALVCARVFRATPVRSFCDRYKPPLYPPASLPAPALAARLRSSHLLMHRANKPVRKQNRACAPAKGVHRRRCNRRRSPCSAHVPPISGAAAAARTLTPHQARDPPPPHLLASLPRCAAAH